MLHRAVRLPNPCERQIPIRTLIHDIAQDNLSGANIILKIERRELLHAKLSFIFFKLDWG